MFNNVVIVGRIAKDIKMEKDKNGNEVCNMTIAVSRPFKNTNGVYETDMIDVLLRNLVADHTCKYCQKGDVIGIKGRLEVDIEKDNKLMSVIADKVTFLSSKQIEENDNISKSLNY